MKQEPLWRVMGQSVRGASHHRAGLPNQDALHWLPSSALGPPLMMAVSDGHGSAKSFRSDRGSQFAAAITVELMQELVDGRPSKPNLSAIKRISEERLPQELVRRWRQTVDADIKAEPFSEEELSKLVDARGETARTEVLGNPRLAYGATALGVLVDLDFILYLQLGDGDILLVGESGEVSRPFVRDARLIANETTSLCMDRAWREIRLRFQTRYGPPPALILAATDGYANSFVNDTAFLRVGTDILEILRRDGAPAVEENLVDWLREASEVGSGDDITLGILYRDEAPTGTLAEVEVDDGSEERPGRDRPEAEGTNEEPGAGKAAEIGSSPSSGDQQGSSEDAEIRSRMLAQLKHKGPHEPSKQGTLRDLVDGDDQAPVD